jgi:hypothetical protein
MNLPPLSTHPSLYLWSLSLFIGWALVVFMPEAGV